MACKNRVKFFAEICSYLTPQGRPRRAKELPYSSESVCQCYANKLEKEIEKSYKKFEEVQIHHDPTIHKRPTGGYYTTPKTATTKYRPLNARPAPSY